MRRCRRADAWAERNRSQKAHIERHREEQIVFVTGHGNIPT